MYCAFAVCDLSGMRDSCFHLSCILRLDSRNTDMVRVRSCPILSGTERNRYISKVPTLDGPGVQQGLSTFAASPSITTAELCYTPYCTKHAPVRI